MVPKALPATAPPTSHPFPSTQSSGTQAPPIAQMHQVASCLGAFTYTVLSRMFFLQLTSTNLLRPQLTCHTLRGCPFPTKV